jgi:hypothetical protein
MLIFFSKDEIGRTKDERNGKIDGGLSHVIKVNMCAYNCCNINKRGGKH